MSPRFAKKNPIRIEYFLACVLSDNSDFNETVLSLSNFFPMEPPNTSEGTKTAINSVLSIRSVSYRSRDPESRFSGYMNRTKRIPATTKSMAADSIRISRIFSFFSVIGVGIGEIAPAFREDG